MPESIHVNPIFRVEGIEVPFYHLLHYYQKRKWELFEAFKRIQDPELEPDFAGSLAKKHLRSMRQEYSYCNERITYLWLDLPPKYKDKIMLRYLNALGANCLGYPGVAQLFSKNDLE